MSTHPEDLVTPQAPPLQAPEAQKPEEIPVRFQPPRSALLIDRFMTQFIKVGGLSIVTAVFGIFIFILVQILPLFGGAKVHELRSIQLPDGKFAALGVDEWGELPVIVSADGSMQFVDLTAGGKVEQVVLPFAESKTITAVHYDSQRHDVVLGTADGYFAVVSVNYSTSFEGGKRKVTKDVKAGPFYLIGQQGSPVRQIFYSDNGESKTAAALQDVNGKIEIYAVTLAQSQSLVGNGEITSSSPIRLTDQVRGTPVKIVVSMNGSDIVVATHEGNVSYFVISGDQAELRQTFKPFEDLKDRSITSMDYVFGGQSLYLTSPSGASRIFSLYNRENENVRLFGKTKDFEPLSGGSSFFDYSVRNKAFLTGRGKTASLRFATTTDIRWEQQLAYDIALGAIGGKYNSLYLLDQKNRLHIFELNDPHPESSFKALFGKIWYEGASGPAYAWQSTGGTDDFEPKLSLVPLIIGTLKGTFYAMLFALPIAVLAAIYTSQFLHSRFRLLVKPTMEIMASLPSVVLGFLAALWLAPILETRVPSIVAILILVPMAALLFGWFWSRLPIRYRVWIKPGYEWIAFLPMLMVFGYVGWNLGPLLERIFFVATDPSTGHKVADFRLWWTQVTSLPFEQRNSLVVGFIMGFAVIPIIFTIAEDAMSNVPPALRSGSLALGASRWQTAVRIVLPTASAGIFSAFMIGLGRAVGETMIVVMATGNTPIMNFNIFSGMRTLSANIAVELPEAPVAGTLYRALFLGALVLFMMTFIVNTLAEILRQRLREKYKTV